MEADQNRIEVNKREIQNAFQQQPKSIVIYVFANQNGRIRDEDVLAFNVIHEAYEFRLESLLIIINGLSKQRCENYESMTILQLQKVLNIGICIENICFVDQFNPESSSERQYLTECILQICVQHSLC